MKATTIRKGTTVISVLSILPHIFCCGIPAVMAIISLGTTVGLAGVLATNPFYKFVDQYHEILIAAAITSVVISGILNFVAYRIDCHTAASHCHHGDCAPKKRSSFKIFLFSLALLCLDLSWFATEKFELGLHQSPQPVIAHPSFSQA
jgi:ABC-type enterochelin transport system permease subunit